MYSVNFVTIFFTVIAISVCTIPDYITVCPHAHPDLAACIINSIELLRPRLTEGIEELGIPPLKQLELGTIIVDRIGDGSRLATNLTDVVVFGATDFKILNLTHTLTKKGRNFEFNVTIPKIHIEGKYELDSKLLFLNLKGNGPFNINATDLIFSCILKGNVVKEEKISHLKFNKMTCDGDFVKASILLENLFNGQEILGKATNDVINDNIDVLAEEIKPSLLKSVEQTFGLIANKITLYFAYEELFP